MLFELREIDGLTGPKARVYSVILDGDNKTLLDQFFAENKNNTKDLLKVVSKIRVMAQDTGCRRGYFKEGEGAWADGMVALRGTGCLRLYGIYFHDAVILFGSGGYKPPGVAAYEDYPPLHAKAQQMQEVAREINRMISNKELKVCDDGTLEVL